MRALSRRRESDAARDRRIPERRQRGHKRPGVPAHHPYSRVTAIPIVFDDTRQALRKAREYFQYKRRCLYCDMVREEITAEERLVEVTPHFVLLVPYASRVPLEAWI